MAITKFIDTYATIAEIDPLMSNFCEYTGKTTLEKETLLKEVSKQIDVFLKYEGSKVSDIQPMEFPRDFNTDFEDFQLKEQTRRLMLSVAFQLAYLMDQKTTGSINLTEKSERKTRYAGLCDGAIQILSIYKYDGNISESGRWY